MVGRSGILHSKSHQIVLARFTIRQKFLVGVEEKCVPSLQDHVANFSFERNATSTHRDDGRVESSPEPDVTHRFSMEF